MGGAAGFLALLATLHVIKPEIDPSWRFISEYAIGRHGWLMTLAFFSFAVSYLALFVSVRPYTRTAVDRVGLTLLLVSAIGLLIGGIFTTDPVTADPGAATTRGTLHNAGGTLGMAMPFAAAFVTWSLSRHPTWRWARRRLWTITGVAWAGFLVSLVSLGALMSKSGGRFGPDVPVGWPNRLEVVGYAVWMIVVATTVLRGRGGGASHG